MLVFSLLSKSSFDVIPDIIQRVNRLNKGKAVPFMLVGNFADEVLRRPARRQVRYPSLISTNLIFFEKVKAEDIRKLVGATPLCDVMELTARSSTDCEYLFRRMYSLYLLAQDFVPPASSPVVLRKREAEEEPKGQRRKRRGNTLPFDEDDDVEDADEQRLENPPQGWAPPTQQRFNGKQKKRTFVVSSMPRILEDYQTEESDVEEDDGSNGDEEKDREKRVPNLRAAIETISCKAYVARRYMGGVVLVGHMLSKALALPPPHPQL